MPSLRDRLDRVERAFGNTRQFIVVVARNDPALEPGTAVGIPSGRHGPWDRDKADATPTLKPSFGEPWDAFLERAAEQAKSWGDWMLVAKPLENDPADMQSNVEI